MSTLITSTPHLFSGICVCGHKYYSHHGNVIMKVATAEAMQSGTWYAECEALGCNEEWEPCPDCPGYFVDKDDPLKDEKIAEIKAPFDSTKPSE